MRVAKFLLFFAAAFVVLIYGVSSCTERELMADPEFQQKLEEARAEKAVKDSTYLAELSRFQKVIVNDTRTGINRIKTTGSTMDVYLAEREGREVSQQLASTVAQKFSQLRLTYQGASGVTVRVLFDGMVMAEADARNTQITAVR